MAQVAQNHVTGGSEIWQRWYYLMSLCKYLLHEGLINKHWVYIAQCLLKLT